MIESERTVNDQAAHGEEVPRRVCTLLLAKPTRYLQWHAHHEGRMSVVAGAYRRERQLLTLRTFALEQVHRTALVRYLRDHRVVGTAREQTLREFHRIMDPEESALVEHRNYVLAASSQLCATDLLELAGDQGGLELLSNYELAYGQFFSMFCEYSRARQNGRPYLLASLLPEVRGTVRRLHARILDRESLPAAPVSRSPRPVRIRTSPPTDASPAPSSTPSVAGGAEPDTWPRSLLVQAMSLLRVPPADPRSEPTESARR
jgi:hypothetical protein